MMQGWCDATNPKSHVVLRQSWGAFVLYLDSKMINTHTILSDAQKELDFWKDFIRNATQVRQIVVHNVGTIEVTDWVRSAAK